MLENEKINEEIDEEIEEEPTLEEIEDLDLWLVLEIKDGNLKAYKKKGYKFDKWDYILKRDNIIIVDKDKRDIRPYTRYLNKNKKERLRHNIIVRSFFALLIIFVSVFGVKWKVKSIKKDIETIKNHLWIVEEKEEKEEIKENNTWKVTTDISKFMEEPKEKNKDDIIEETKKNIEIDKWWKWSKG